MRQSNSIPQKVQQQAHIFAALGDATRLSLVSRLVDGKPHSLSSLASGTKVTRQAITKHLTVLENVGLVSNFKSGRESLYELNPGPLESLQKYLEVISSQWGQTLLRLKKFAEKN